MTVHEAVMRSVNLTVSVLLLWQVPTVQAQSACDVAAGADGRVINVVDTSDYNSFDTPVFKQISM